MYAGKEFLLCVNHDEVWFVKIRWSMCHYLVEVIDLIKYWSMYYLVI